ncbi:MAG: sigma-70 family RNA polymerase sigma factor [Gemmatimonadetes bacterium]|nr:sigma-70 family RNA polymerase sigma factor [Gemmatimonadota bacterium]
MSRTETVARLLDDLQRGRKDAFDELFAVVYDELHAMAQFQRRRFTGHETLNTTALVHEAYLKLGGQPDRSWNSRAHFMAAAAKAIRHILLNYARDQGTRKRGGDWRRTSLDHSAVAAKEDRSIAQREALIALDDALGRLEISSERLSRIVECRFFGGMSLQETAAALDISTATVTRGWAAAQAWLYRDLEYGSERA